MNRPTPAVIDAAVLAAFDATRAGRSPDYVVCDPELDDRYLDHLREVSGIDPDDLSDADANRRLLALRKRGLLADRPTTRTYRLPARVHPLAFIAEWAARHVQRTAVADRLVLGPNEPTLDDILCDPALRHAFTHAATRLAAPVASDIAPTDWAWAALGFRKRGRRTAELGTPLLDPAAPDRLRPVAVLTPDRTARDAAPPDRPGLYAIADDTGTVAYAGHTPNLRRAMGHHRAVAGATGIDLVPDWLHPADPPATRLGWVPLTGPPGHRQEARIALVARHHPYLNLTESRACG